MVKAKKAAKGKMQPRQLSPDQAQISAAGRGTPRGGELGRLLAHLAAETGAKEEDLWSYCGIRE